VLIKLPITLSGQLKQ